MAQIIVNDEKQEVTLPLTLAELIKINKVFQPEMVTIQSLLAVATYSVDLAEHQRASIVSKATRWECALQLSTHWHSAQLLAPSA